MAAISAWALLSVGLSLCCWTASSTGLRRLPSFAPGTSAAIPGGGAAAAGVGCLLQLLGRDRQGSLAGPVEEVLPDQGLADERAQAPLRLQPPEQAAQRQPGAAHGSDDGVQGIHGAKGPSGRKEAGRERPVPAACRQGRPG